VGATPGLGRKILDIIEKFWRNWLVQMNSVPEFDIFRILMKLDSQENFKQSYRLQRRGGLNISFLMFLYGAEVLVG